MSPRARVRTAAYGVKSLDEIDLTRALDPEIARALDRDAPDALPVPSGRSARLDYADDGSVSASVKLQELFGLAETPRIGSRREPVVLHLLAPNSRPVQSARSPQPAGSHVSRGQEKELRGRYRDTPGPMIRGTPRRPTAPRSANWRHTDEMATEVTEGTNGKHRGTEKQRLFTIPLPPVSLYTVIVRSISTPDRSCRTAAARRATSTNQTP